MTRKEDIQQLGFKFAVLTEHSFAYNMRRVETLLQTAFFDCANRCWRARGAGSYWTSERELNVREINNNIVANSSTNLHLDSASRNENHEAVCHVRALISHSAIKVCEELAFVKIDA
jgi:hypothetical protein